MDSHSTYARRRALNTATAPWPRLLRLEPGWATAALAVALGYYLAARVGFAFTLQPHPISTLWPPNALLMAALLLAPTRAWWLLLAAALPAHLLAELQSGVPTVMVLAWFASNCSEALIGAGLVRAFVPGRLRLDSLRNAGAFLLCGALAAPLLSSFLDAALVKLIGWGSGAYLDLVRMRFSSNVLAELTVVPLILTWAAFGAARLREVPARRWLEAAALFLGLLGASLVAFDLPLVDANTAPALFYAPLPFLLWAAVRLGPAGTASALALLVTVTIWGAVSGLGPFAGGEPQDTARDMQLFLIAVAVPMLLLAVALEERSRAAHDAREQRLQLTHLSRVALLGQLSGGLAHELNQPLTVILSNAQAAQRFLERRELDREELGEILRDIIAADQRAGEVIRRLRRKRPGARRARHRARRPGDARHRSGAAARRGAAAGAGRPRRAAAGAAQPGGQRLRGDEHRRPRAAPPRHPHRAGRRRGAHQRHRPGMRVPGRAVPEAVPGLLHHQAAGPRPRAFHLALDRARPPRPAVGRLHPGPRRELPYLPAGAPPGIRACLPT
jgi:integral membrane sensor domain MASE1